MSDAISDSQLQSLIQAAVTVRKHAYAPYSQFAVGAALLTLNGKIHVGCNVENASFGLTLCGERVAASTAVAAGQTDFVHLVLVTKDAASPCGACRQFLAEFSPSLMITMVEVETLQIVSQVSLADLLPQMFRDFQADS